MALTAVAKVFSHASEWSELSTETNTEMPSPILFWSTSATRRRITPSASRRWMRFQHGVEDRPTRSPISATDSEASSCSTVRILRSMASSRRFGSCNGTAVARSVMRRKFHMKGLKPSYREKSSHARPLSPRSGVAGRLALAQKRCDFSTLRGGKGAPEAGAFQRRGGGGESQRLRQFLPLRNGQRKGAVEYVAGAQRIDGVDGEGGGFPQLAVRVEPDGAPGPARAGQERLRQSGD